MQILPQQKKIIEESLIEGGPLLHLANSLNLYFNLNRDASTTTTASTFGPFWTVNYSAES